MAKDKSWAISPDKNKHQYVVGIDLGHGETSAAYAEIGWDKAAGSLDPVKDIDLGNNKTYVMPSAISFRPNGSVYVGAQAFNQFDADLYVCFKKRPESLQGEAEKIMISYMREVYNVIRETAGAILNANNHVVYIATPSAWDEKTQDLYGQMAKEAGLPIAGVTWESRAAFIKAQSSADSGLPQYVDKGAVVFDMGSSTLDFTYISSEVLKDNKKPIDFGYDCGASKVERLMYAKLKDENEVIEEFEQKYPKAIDRLLFEMRLNKEKYFRNKDHFVRGSVDFYDIINDTALDTARFRYNGGELETLLDRNGYINEIRKAMIDFKENHIAGKPIYAAFFTGGASRMDFLEDLVKEIWGVELKYKDQNPSLTISQGVAEAARSDIRSGGAGNIKQMIKKIMSGIDVYDIFSEKLGAKMKEELQASIATPVCGFRDSESDLCLAVLEEAIQNNIESDIDNVGDWAKECMEQAFEEATSDIRTNMSKMMANYSKTEIAMGKISGSGIQLPELDIDVVSTQIQEIAGTFSESSSDWTDIVKDAALGGVAGFLLGPIGWIGAGIYAFFKYLSGNNESEEEKREKAKHKDLDEEQRLKVYNEFSQKWDHICDKIDDAVDGALDDYSIKQKVNSQCELVLRKYAEDCLRETRLMID